MRILIADDDDISLLTLKTALSKRGHEVVDVADGTLAWEVLQTADAPPLAILDWMMPGHTGLELCRMVRARKQGTYLILLTANREKADIIQGLQAGANDYITKPFDREELFARLQAGICIIELRQSLEIRVRELEVALAQVKQLSGLLPICCYCKNIRDDKNYWQRVEDYVSTNSDARFSHGICPKCYETVVEAQIAELMNSPAAAHD
jgi:sigma-B regulation protein RsbU (phosphoserine phosphatase)